MTDAYMLRTCRADMTSRGGFTWPTSGHVEAPDWDPAPECGRGLHGLLWGEGNGKLLDWSDDARWLVCKIDADEAVDIKGKIKVPRCEVVFVGTHLDATQRIRELGARGAVVGATATAGRLGTATAGDGGEIRIRWNDGARYRLAVGYVGEGGINANVAYRCDKHGKLVRA